MQTVFYEKGREKTMKSSDEIKKGLNDPIPVHFHIGDPEPRLTPLMTVDLEELHADALALIQQLEAQNAEKDARIQQLEAERDAAVELLKSMGCDSCIHDEYKVPNPHCLGCDGRNLWEWRGVQKEE
jgi:hypothetical protein